MSKLYRNFLIKVAFSVQNFGRAMYITCLKYYYIISNYMIQHMKLCASYYGVNKSITVVSPRYLTSSITKMNVTKNRSICNKKGRIKKNRLCEFENCAKNFLNILLYFCDEKTLLLDQLSGEIYIFIQR